VTLAGAGFATQTILAKAAYGRGADVPTVLAVRFAVAALAVWGVLWWVRRRGEAVALRQPPGRLLGLGVLGLLFVGSATTGYLALDRLPAGTTTLLLYVFPALVVLWSRLLFGERLTGPKLFALGLALVGCALTVDPVAALGDGGLSLAGVGLALGSAVCISWYATLSGPLTRGLPGLTAAAYSLPATAACFLGYLVARGGVASDITPGGWAICLVIGLVSGVVTYAFLTGVARIGGSRAAITMTSEPAIAVALGALFLGEALAPVTLLGGLGIVAAIVLLARAAPG
jgi:drug/metabolite transporter (DMT)-like permease